MFNKIFYLLSCGILIVSSCKTRQFHDPSHSKSESTNTTVRFATYNCSLNRESSGELIEDLSDQNNKQAQTVAEVIQRVRPQVLLLNEFDYDDSGKALELFQKNYLAISQNGQAPIEYSFHFLAPSNTGVASGFDLDRDGQVSGGGDSFGFGNFPGQFGMVVLSQFPIDKEKSRTFQKFLMKDQPDNLAIQTKVTNSNKTWYSDDAKKVLRLTSKNMWDLPIQIQGQIIHFIVAHPTPPAFDGKENRNGRRNWDEVRFVADYVTPGKGQYIYDDNGVVQELGTSAHFVVAGDMNSDPQDGDQVQSGAINLLLNAPRVNSEQAPSSEGALQASHDQGEKNVHHKNPPSQDTGDFYDKYVGNLRLDYVLPSKSLIVENSAVFWPKKEDALWYLVDPEHSSDHHLVWVDLKLPQ